MSFLLPRLTLLNLTQSRVARSGVPMASRHRPGVTGPGGQESHDPFTHTTYIHMFGRFFQYLSGSGGRDAAIGGVSGPLVRRHTSVLGGTQRHAHTHIVATVLRRRVATTGTVGRRADCTPSRPYPGSLCSVLSRPRVTRVRYRASRADRYVWPKKERRMTLIHRGDEKYSSHGLLDVSRERTCHAGLYLACAVCGEVPCGLGILETGGLAVDG